MCMYMCVVSGDICVCMVCVCAWEGGVVEEICSYVCNVSLITAN